MDKVDSDNIKLLKEAISIWTGWGKKSSPRRDDTALIIHYGLKASYELLPLLRYLENEFYLSDARHVADDLSTMGKLAAEQFRKKHPEVAEEVVQALAWCYTFDYK